MAFDIGKYNGDFKAFVKFADNSMRTDSKAVARFTLKDGESATAAALPTGIVYTVEQAATASRQAR